MCFKIYYNFEVCCGGHKKGGSRYSEVFHDYVVNMAKVSLGTTSQSRFSTSAGGRHT